MSDAHTTRFEVIECFDLPSRAATAVVGRVISGNAFGGMWLRDEGSAHAWYVTGIEFPTPKMMRNGWTSLLLDRADEPPRAGTMLVPAT